MQEHVDPVDVIPAVMERAAALYRENALRIASGGTTVALAGDAMNVVDDVYVSVYVVISGKAAANRIAEILSSHEKFDSGSTARKAFRRELP